jgi:hypothetical protein
MNEFRNRAAFCVAISFASVSTGCGAGEAQRAAPGAASEQPAFSLDEGALTLNPGQEGLFCRQMAVPAAFADGDTFVTGIDADVSLGTHHLIVTASDEAPGSVPTLCHDTGSGQAQDGSFQDFAVDPNPLSVLETLKRVELGGGGGSAKIQFPKGYGKAMPLGFFESSHHVLNVGQNPIDIHGRFDFFTAKGAEIEFPMGVIFANALKVDIAPQSDGSVEGTLTVPEAIDLVALTSHAHNFLTRFEMYLYRDGKTASEPIYVSESYETPAVVVQDPPVRLNPGDGVTFRCTYRNNTANKVAWGVTGGEMCMPFAMYAYPDGRAHGAPPTMSAAMSSEAPVALAVGTAGFGG